MYGRHGSWCAKGDHYLGPAGPLPPLQAGSQRRKSQCMEVTWVGGQAGGCGQCRSVSSPLARILEAPGRWRW